MSRSKVTDLYGALRSARPFPGKETVRDEVGRLLGRLHHLAGERPATVEEMNEAVKRRAAERFKEAVRR